MQSAVYIITGTTPAAPGNAVLGTIAPDVSLVSPNVFADISQFESLALSVSLIGATGGALDVYIQSSPDLGVSWEDIAHSPQVAAGGGAVRYRWNTGRWNGSATAVVTGDMVLAVNTYLQGEWGDRLRVKVLAGAGTSAGAAVSFRFHFNRVYPKI